MSFLAVFLLTTFPLLRSASLPATPEDLAKCRSWKEANATVAAALALGPPPTRIGLMPVRYLALVEAEAGLKKTHVSGVGLEHGQFVPATVEDDSGLSLSVPWLADKLGLSVARAYDLFFELMIAFSFVSGVLGLFALTPARWPRLLGLAALTLTLALACRTGDVYIITAAVPIALVPWILAALSRSSMPVWLVIGALAGAMSAFSNVMRSQSGTSLLLFLGLAWGLSTKLPFRLRLAGCGSALLSCALVSAVFLNVIARRDTFLRVHGAYGSHRPPQHPFWHPLYLGLRYTSSDSLKEYRDDAAIAKVCSVDPYAGFVSQEYEHILRNATFETIHARPALVVRNLFWKAAVLLGYLLIFGNIGWLALLRRSMVWPIDPAFFVAIGFNSLFGLLVAPVRPYLLGLIAYAALYGVTSSMLATGSRAVAD